MSLFFFVILINVASILFLMMSLLRLRNYLLRNRFEESKYTLLFGFVRIEVYVYAYVICTLIFGTFLWVLMS